MVRVHIIDLILEKFIFQFFIVQYGYGSDFFICGLYYVEM